MTTATRKTVVNGTTYHEQTAPEVIRILERFRANQERIRIHYGDTKTGRDWLEEWDVCGRVSRSMGSEKIPLLIASARSIGGPGILDHCIVRITTTTNPRRVLYSVPNYHYGTPALIETPVDDGGIVYESTVTIDGNVHARFRTKNGAANWLRKMNLKTGERN